MIELLAITRGTAPPPPSRLRVLSAGGLAAVVAPVSRSEPIADALSRHEELVRALMADRDVLPVRYGTRFADDEEAAQAVVARRATLSAALDHVTGAVELSVHAPADARDRLRPLARDCVDRPGRTAYLVDRDAADVFRARAGDLGVICTAPSPPYSFSEAPPESRRIGTDPENVAKGLGQLVLTIVELLRQLMERQALRRIDAGGLSAEQVERLGTTFMELDKRMEQLRAEFDLEPEDLNLDLGPLGRLI